MTTEKTKEGEAQEPQEAVQAEEARPRRRTKRTSRATAKQETPEAKASASASAEAESKPKRRKRTTRAKAEAPAPEPTDGVEPRPAPRGRSGRRAAAVEEPPPAVPARPLPRLLEKLRTEVGSVMMREFNYTSVMQIPRLSKVVLNIGLGEALENSRAIEKASGDLALISGQQPVVTRARKSIAGFKIRQGMPIGVTVTLRGRRMYEFMDRLISSSLPRIRDFQGLPRGSFDGRGNYALGIREQVIFPEIDYNSIDRIRGLQVVIGTTARTDSEGLRMLELLGMPFARTREATQVA